MSEEPFFADVVAAIAAAAGEQQIGHFSFLNMHE